MRILLLESTNGPTPRLSFLLQAMGHTLDKSDSIQTVKELLALEQYDLIVLDFDALDQDGWDALIECQKNNADILTLAVLSNGDQAMLNRGPDLGVHDFLLRPFDARELSARIGFLLSRGKTRSATMQQLGALSFDTYSRMTMINGAKIDLTMRETSVLEILFRRPGQIVSKDQIASNIFSIDDEADLSSIKTYIYRVRQKISNSNVTIRSVRGLGYVLQRVDETQGNDRPVPSQKST